MTELLLVEDDPVIVSTLSDFLRSEGFSVSVAGGQRQAMAQLAAGHIQLALLDVGLPDGSGFALCSAIKAQYNIPVIFLTALDDEISTVTGLDLGGDDYIAKPFRPRELVSRIRGVLRRSASAPPQLTLGPVRVDPVRCTATLAGKPLTLSPLEYRLLLLFLNHPGAVLSRGRILDEMWGLAGGYVADNTLTVYIKRLRDKIEPDPQNPTLIRTVRGLGYQAGEAP